MASNKVTAKFAEVLAFINDIFTTKDDAWVGIEGIINYTAKEGIEIVDALELYSPLIRKHVRRAAMLVERLIPDGTADARLRLFDKILKSYILIDVAIDNTKIDKRLFAAARMLLEAMLIEKKATGTWPAEVPLQALTPVAK